MLAVGLRGVAGSGPAAVGKPTPQHELRADRTVEHVVPQHATRVVHFQHLAEWAGGQAEEGGVQEHRAEGFPRAQLGERVVGGGADHSEHRAVRLTCEFVLDAARSETAPVRRVGGP